MTIDDARDLARLYFDDVFNHGNLAVVDRIVAPAFTLLIPRHWEKDLSSKGVRASASSCSEPVPRSRTCGSPCTR